MESSASPSGASSHATQTGRPSMWTESGQRKLGRLYLYTTLPIKKILDVVHSPSPESGPGKDSANKKLNGMFDKEPRWLHPRTRTDMERRMEALDKSPIRTGRREFPSPVSAPPASQATVSPANGYFDVPPMSPMEDWSHIGPNTTGFAHQDPGVSVFAAASNDLSTNGHGHQHAASSRGIQGGLVDGDVQMADAEHLQPPHLLPALRRLSSPFRRSTVMSNSTDITTTTLRKALSGYSAGFVTHVKRVMKRYTMPVRSPNDPSPTGESRPQTAFSTAESWVDDEHGPLEIICAPPLPGEFLILDRLLQITGACPQGEEYHHRTKNCLCRPLAAMGESLWMSNTGLSELGARLVLPGNALPADFETRDVFGNSLMHLLAARDVNHMYILQLVKEGVSCRERNSAGQTFLHLLDPSWVTDPKHGLQLLVTLLRAFQSDLHFFYARDCYGRTLFHVLHSKLEDHAPFNQLLGYFNMKLFRDAFDVAPACGVEESIKPVRRAFTSVANEHAPATRAHEPPPLPRCEPDLMTRQAQLLAFVRRCQDQPRTEDGHGRNGLHCLASAILSDVSLLRQSGQGENGTPGASRKRKREEGGDSSKKRLEVREKIVNNLLMAGVRTNSYDGAGNTPLMAFVAHLPEDDDHKGPVTILQLLIDAGAELNARNRRGETALHIAVRRGRKLAMRTLAQAGANVHVRDASGRSLLDVADERVALEPEDKRYMHFEACRAWLTGQGGAVQDPGLLDEWALQ